MKETGAVLRTIGGVILIQTANEPRLYCIEDLEHENTLTIGQLFNAVRILNGKTIQDYGKDWPYFSIQEGERKGEPSQQFRTISSVLKNRSNDLERLQLVCSQLNEEMPAIIARDKVQERLDLFKDTIASLQK